MSIATDTQAQTQRAPTNRLFAVYLLVSATALFFVHRPKIWPALLLLHLLGAALALGLGPLGRLTSALAQRFPNACHILADWYPVMLVPALYTELATLNVAVWNGAYFDSLIQHLDRALFGGGLPSSDFSRRWPFLWLSEWLHASYLSYYFIIYAPPLILYLSKRRAEFRTMIFTVMLAFFVHYLFFIYFPVQGPRYLFPAPGGAISEGPMYGLTHKILEAGSSRGAAFPSSHLGVALTQTLLTIRFLPRLGALLALCTLGLALGAVYGGFHYATDMIAGFIMGIAVVLAAPSLRRLLNGNA